MKRMRESTFCCFLVPSRRITEKRKEAKKKKVRP